MRKNKKFIRFAIISFLVVTSLISLLYGLCFLTEIDLNNIDMNFFTLYIGSILSIYIPFIFMCLCINISYKLGKKVVDIEAGHIDLKKDKRYFREILNDYGILELAYINNFSKLEKKDILATILNLEMKKVIKLENNQIVEVDKSIPITQTEEYVLRKCISGKVRIDRLDIISEMAKNDAVDKGLIEKENDILKDIIIMFFKTNTLSLILSIIIVILFQIIESNINETLNVILGLIILLSICICSYRVVYLVSYSIHKFKSYKLTSKGKEIKSKLEGLKLYIKEFGNLEDDSKDSITLWQDYLIYSVMFGVNNTIEKEMEDFIEIENQFKNSKKKLFIFIFIVLLLFLIII